ncbi:PREDICTED: allergin-1 [Elephantulus edwardii]|uniref:allergin-1 n=1 Tax=Elephantulus edwardii TaxID=28737 RepID=UPI0003F0CE02|nr:PREDICTED: allergin-1 [Elephantulus edwardii]
MWCHLVKLVSWGIFSSLSIQKAVVEDGAVKKTAEESMIFNLSISGAQDLGPYKCKVSEPNCSRYSQEFTFRFAGRDDSPLWLQLLFPGFLLTLKAIALIVVYWLLRKQSK